MTKAERVKAAMQAALANARKRRLRRLKEQEASE